MLDERKTAILSAVVQEYITTALPVGSTHIADAPGVRVSPATIRNEMAVLEQEGYLVQPHTSAGRVPTDKGYRFFVDSLLKSRAPSEEDPAFTELRRQLDAARDDSKALVAAASQLLSNVTRLAGVVTFPRAQQASITQIAASAGAPAGRADSRPCGPSMTSSTWSVLNTASTTLLHARAISATEPAGRPPACASRSTFAGSTS